MHYETAEAPRRIVSLLPSATEILCALGAEAEIVGVSHECDFPDTVRTRPMVTVSRVHTSTSSVAIDEAVQASLLNAVSIYTVDEHALAELAPDVVVTQDLCQVCAISFDDVARAIAAIAHKRSVNVVSLRPTCLNDVLDDILRVASAIGRDDQGHAVRATLKLRIEAIARRAAESNARPRVVSVEWLDPLMLGGLWMPELIALAGGTAVGAIAGEPAPTVTSRALAQLDPDRVIIKPCGFSIQRTLSESATITSAIRSVVRRECDVFVTDGNAFFNRPGPRLVESLEILASCIHPMLFADFTAKHNNARVAV